MGTMMSPLMALLLPPTGPGALLAPAAPPHSAAPPPTHFVAPPPPPTRAAVPPPVPPPPTRAAVQPPVPPPSSVAPAPPPHFAAPPPVPSGLSAEALRPARAYDSAPDTLRADLAAMLAAGASGVWGPLAENGSGKPFGATRWAVCAINPVGQPGELLRRGWSRCGRKPRSETTRSGSPLSDLNRANRSFDPIRRLGDPRLLVRRGRGPWSGAPVRATRSQEQGRCIRVGSGFQPVPHRMGRRFVETRLRGSGSGHGRRVGQNASTRQARPVGFGQTRTRRCSDLRLLETTPRDDPFDGHSKQRLETALETAPRDCPF
ncbi:hypothetical protein M885DRAFT_206553 [Pelagophyceae sp. CCMP2097]|nr:hypothetical protein M885DRAFT_206553 [Pelagophyceae sp. CCMP2097]